jgi:hypothetical protein
MNFGGEIPLPCRNPWPSGNVPQGHGVRPRPGRVRPVNEAADRPVSDSFGPLAK